MPASKTDAQVIKCPLCDVCFGMEAKLQRHLLKVHVVGVSVAPPVVGVHVSQEQRRAHEGASAAIEAANRAMESGAACPHCRPTRKTKPFSNALDLATHIIAKHFPGEGFLSEDDEVNGSATSRCVKNTATAMERGPVASEISERLLNGNKKRSGSGLDPAGSKDGVKRTKLLCVDVSKPTAQVPQSVTLPTEPVARRPNAKSEPFVIGPCEQNTHSVEKKACEEGGAAPPTSKGLLSVPTKSQANIARTPSNDAEIVHPRTPMTARKPPPTPKSLTNAGDCVRMAASVPSACETRDLPPRTTVVAANVGHTPPPPAGPQAAVILDLPVGPLGLLPERVLTRGFDFDIFADVSDFPSSVEKAYYRSSSSKVAAVDCASHR